jgi:hypothetical protein
MPGDNTEIIGELIHPIAMEKGLRFAIREGGKTVASGQVVEVIESRAGNDLVNAGSPVFTCLWRNNG